MTCYTRRVAYYETDQMSIVHHANYIRWMEEARMDYMRQRGLLYEDMEDRGIIMPVTDVSCRYQHSARFGDEVRIETTLTQFNGVRAAFSYRMYTDHSDVPAAVGHSSHCFLDRESRSPISLKRRYPAFYQGALALVEEEA